MRMVGAKNSKGALVDLVNWLLSDVEKLRAENVRLLRQNEQLHDVAAILEAARAENARLREMLVTAQLHVPKDDPYHFELRAALEGKGT
jgi:hypothetical protein